MKKIALYAVTLFTFLLLSLVNAYALPSDTNSYIDTDINTDTTDTDLNSHFDTDTNTETSSDISGVISSLAETDNTNKALPDVTSDEIKYPQSITSNVKPDPNNQKIWGIVCGWIFIIIGAVILIRVLMLNAFNKKNKSKTRYKASSNFSASVRTGYRKNKYK